jgi:hypothetical protein
MRFSIVSRDRRLEPAQIEWLRRRADFALGRFGDRVRRVRVRLRDLNGPRGGLDQACGLDVLLTSGELVTVEAVRESMESAATAALDRMARRLRDQFNRRRELGRYAGLPKARGAHTGP